MVAKCFLGCYNVGTKTTVRKGMMDMKKLIALILSMVTLFSVCVPIFSMSYETEGFEDGSVSSEWKNIGDDSADSGASIAEAPDALISYNSESLNALHLGNKSGVSSVCKNFPDGISDGEIAFDIRIDAIGTLGITVEIGECSVIEIKRAASLGEDAPFQMYYKSADGNSVLIETELQTSLWYTFNVLLSKGASNAELFVNGVKAAEIYADSGNSAEFIRFTNSCGENGNENSAYIDNVSVIAKDAEDALYSEDFEEVAAETLPDGWISDGASGITVSDGAGKALYLSQSGAWTGSQKTIEGDIPNIGEIYFEVYLDQVGAKGLRVEFTNGSKTKCMLGFSRGLFDVNSPVIFCYLDPTHTTVIGNSINKTFVPISVGEIVTGNLYRIRIVMLNEKNKAMLYINGVEIGKIFAQTSVINVNTIIMKNMSSSETLENNSYIDNVRLYASGASEPYFEDDFSDSTIGEVPNGWINDGKGTLKQTVQQFSFKQIASNSAIKVKQSENANIPNVLRTIQPSDDFSLMFDYLPTVVGSKGHRISLKSGDETVAYYTVSPDEKTFSLYAYDGSVLSELPADITLNVWHRITISVADGRLKLILGEKLLVDQKIDMAIDAISFETVSDETTGEEYYIDNFKLVNGDGTEVDGVAAEFTDNFDAEPKYYKYSGSGSHTVDNGKLSLSGEVEVKRQISAVMSGKFGFTINTDTLEGVKFGLMSGDSLCIAVKARADGALMFARSGDWVVMSEPGVLETGKDIVISFDLPFDRNVNYMVVKVNGVQVGTAIYDLKFTAVDGIMIAVPEGCDAAVDDVFGTASEGIIQMPEREESSPDIYLPIVIEGAKPMINSADKSPATTSLSYATAEDGFTLDSAYLSVGADLGTVTKVNALRITGSAEIARPSTFDRYTVWKSDDNITWEKIPGFTYNHYTENGVSVALFEFSGVEARYVKVNSKASTGKFVVTSAINDVRAEVRPNVQYKMAGYAMYAIGDNSPESTPMTRELYKKQITIHKGDSVGINFGLNSAVEAIELVADGLSVLDEKAFDLYYSSDNSKYEKIDDVILSRDVRDGKDIYRFTFDSIVCGYLKLTLKADVNITLADLYDGLCAYSSEEAKSVELRKYTTNRGGEGDFYTLPDGTLVMLYTKYPEETHGDFNYTDLGATKSEDGGITWSEPWTNVYNPEGGLNLMSASAHYMANGDLALFYLERFAGENGSTYTYIRMRRSTDGGMTWSEPSTVAAEPFGYTGWTSGISGLHLSNGRFIIAVNYAYLSGDVYGSDRVTIFVTYTDDDGKTWKNSPGIITLPNGVSEATVAELENGNLLMTMRTRKENAIYQSISTDNGLTWAQPVAVEGLDTPSSTNVVCTIPATGDVLLVWNNEKYDASNGNGKRDPLSTAISSDNGLTYKNIRNIVDANASWPAVRFYGRSVVIGYGPTTNMKIIDISELYQTRNGSVTVSDLVKAATPSASYADGWLNGVSVNMMYSLDGGATWRYCGGSSVKIGDFYGNVLVRNMGSATANVSEIQNIAVENPVTDGELNKYISWSYANGVLTITGKGKIKNFSAGKAPWSALADKVDTVVIGEGITYIGASAFYGFNNVTTVSLPDTLTAIGNYAFYGCSSLKDITIPEKVTEIGAFAFRRSALESVTFAIGYGWSAGDNAFTLDEIVTCGATYLATGFYKTVWTRDINAEVETMDPNFVDGGVCGNNIKWTVTKLENGKLKLTVSGEGAMPTFSTGYTPWFGYAADIVEVEVTEGVTTIGRCAFYGLKFVRKATIADTVTAIDDYGFYMCFLLKSIELPEGVTIGKDAFVKTGVSEIPTV